MCFSRLFLTKVRICSIKYILWSNNVSSCMVGYYRELREAGKLQE